MNYETEEPDDDISSSSSSSDDDDDDDKTPGFYEFTLAERQEGLFGDGK